MKTNSNMISWLFIGVLVIAVIYLFMTRKSCGCDSTINKGIQSIGAAKPTCDPYYGLPTCNPKPKGGNKGKWDVCNSTSECKAGMVCESRGNAINTCWET